jgi:hypothetical protein
LSTSATRGLFTSLSRELKLTKSKVDDPDTMLSYLCMLGEMFTSTSQGFRSQSSRTSKPKSSKQEYLKEITIMKSVRVYLRYLFFAFSLNIEVIGLSPLIIVFITRSLIFAKIIELSTPISSKYLHRA